MLTDALWCGAGVLVLLGLFFLLLRLRGVQQPQEHVTNVVAPADVEDLVAPGAAAGGVVITARPVEQPAALPPPAGPAFALNVAEREWHWQVSEAKRTGKLQAMATARGTRVSGFALTALATTAATDPPFRAGRLELNLTAFSPASDSLEQKAGRWYLSGEWTLIDANATPEQARGRRSGSAIRGQLLADLPFNPLDSDHPFTADLTIPMSPTGNQWLRGKGTWAVGTDFGGALSLYVRAIRGAGYVPRDS